MTKRKNNEKQMDEKPVVTTDFERESARLMEAVEEEKQRVEEICEALADDGSDEQKRLEAEGELDSLKRANSNIRRAYFSAVSVTDGFSSRLHDISKSRKRRRFFPAAPANFDVDLSERKLEHFAGGLSTYKLLLVCFIGSFAGVVIEMLWCLLKRGYLESRAGLVYGPFNMLYGAGAVVLTVCLYGLRNHSKWLSFVGGFAVGSVVEYVCSWGQEMFLGSRSWDYSSKPFNINGRICLLYSVFWGFLGVLWVKNLYPRIASLILKIPEKVGKAVTVAMTVFFVFNCTVTCIAVYRWSERVDSVPPSNGFWEFVDDRFPDDRMERVFANMDFEGD